MALKARDRSVAQIIARSKARPETDWSKVSHRRSVRRDAADEAKVCRSLLAEGASLNELWRFGILQTVDHYESAVMVGELALATQIFDREPDLTGAAEIDASFAALAEYLAHRDGWEPPTWVGDPSRSTQKWHVAQSAGFYTKAERETPKQFRTRGVFSSSNDLSRA